MSRKEGRAESLLPPRTRRPRQEGNPRPFWGFRPTAELMAFVDAKLAKERLEKSGVLVYMLEVAMSLMQELGDDWYEIERLAKVGDSSPGAVIARLIKDALHPQRKPKK